MDDTVTEVADELRAASGVGGAQEVLARRFAEAVELRHDPPSPSDGPIPGALLAEVSRREVEAVGRALRDRVDGESEVTVDGDVIHLRGRTQGTLHDGSTIDVRTSTRFTVAKGEIVALQSEMDAASGEAWGRVLTAGGFEVPAGAFGN
jgi:hypothetical protein